MKIRLRTSGGRGEYEVTGSQDNIRIQDIYDKRIFLSVLPSIYINTFSNLTKNHGKSRIRLIDAKQGEHSYLTISNILLLPKPIREIGKTIGPRVKIADGTYSISEIDFLINRISSDSVYIQPTWVLIQNYFDDKRKVDFIERLALVKKLWEYADDNNSTISNNDDILSLLRDHLQAIRSSDLTLLRNSTKAIRNLIHSEQDPLVQLLSKFDLSDTNSYSGAIHVESLENPEHVISPISLSKVEVSRKWRQLIDRGNNSLLFRKNIQRIYDYKCIFSGLRLPSTVVNKNPGVDAAHILPWSMTRNDDVQNGFCANKLCHWAFDNFIIKLDFDFSANLYLIELPEIVSDLHIQGEIDLSYFQHLPKVISRQNLPSNPEYWPDPQLIAEYNTAFDI